MSEPKISRGITISSRVRMYVRKLGMMCIKCRPTWTKLADNSKEGILGTGLTEDTLHKAQNMEILTRNIIYWNENDEG